jgi:hypothetical protein
MAGTRLTQTSFSRGELAPALYMRTEIEQYSLGSKEIKNGFIHQEGCVSNRSGFEYVGEVKNNQEETRVFAFQFNSEQTYIIEAGDKYFRFIQDGGYILADEEGEEIYEIETPYAKEDLSHLKFVQSADVLTITHIDYEPHELIRYDHNLWKLNPIIVEPCIAPPTNVKATWTGKTDSNTREYSYLVTSVDKETTEESVRSEVATATGHREASWLTDEYMTITCELVEGAAEYNVYRNVNGVFGYIGTSVETEDAIMLHDNIAFTIVETNENFTSIKFDDDKVFYVEGELSVDKIIYTNQELVEYYGLCTALTNTDKEKKITIKKRGVCFTDDCIEPDLKEAAPLFENPFEDGNHPSCATYFQQRKVYANSVKNPQTFWASQLATSNNFNISRPLIASDAITQTLADREVNEIRHLVGLNHLIALTSNTEYRVNGSDGVFQANPSPVATVQSNYGASHVQPIISGNMIIFVQSGGSVLRDLGYDYLSDSYNGAELSLFASHLFEGKTVKYMAYAKEPYRLVWIIFSDGSCACLTYNKTQKICGWTRIVTDGFFESAAAVREGQEDIVYFVIRRYIKPTYQGEYVLLNSERNSSGVMVYCYECEGNNYYSEGPLVIGVDVYSDAELTNFVGKVNVLNEAECNVTIGGIEKRYIERTKKRIIKTVQEGFFVDCGLSGTFSEEKNVITTLQHLAGKKVVAVSRGGVIDGLQVDENGEVQLPFPVREITIGLPFKFKLETLNIEGENTQGLKKIINNVCVNISNSREEFWVGGTEGIYAQTDRSIESINNSNKLFSKDVSATPFNSPTANATVIVAQHNPLPLTILSLSAMFSLEDISDTQ